MFANLAEFTDSLPLSELEPGLRAHARTTLMSEGTIYFDEAGSGDSSGIPVHEIVIDLPVTNASSQRSTVIRQVLDRVEHVLKPTVTHVVDHEPELRRALRDDVLPYVRRRPTGALLRG